jgi:hypothetical protein
MEARDIARHCVIDPRRAGDVFLLLASGAAGDPGPILAGSILKVALDLSWDLRELLDKYRRQQELKFLIRLQGENY